MVWPFNFIEIPTDKVLLNIFSGVIFSLAIYLFFKALSAGDASRVVPFVFAFSTVFDFIFSNFFKNQILKQEQIIALVVLVVGSGLLTFSKGKFLGKKVYFKFFAALFMSLYNFSWHFSAIAFSAQNTGKQLLNFFMWNRVGAAGILLALLIIPTARKNIFRTEHIENKKQTSYLFLLKQVLGGSAFALSNYLLAIGNVAVFTSLQGLRYGFLFIAGLVFSYTHSHLVYEDLDRHSLIQKFSGLALIFVGTLILFIN